MIECFGMQVYRGLDFLLDESTECLPASCKPQLSPEAWQSSHSSYTLYGPYCEQAHCDPAIKHTYEC